MILSHVSFHSYGFRFCEVTREGDVRLSDVPRQLIYGIMVSVRQTIVSDASWAMSRAVCIAVRYSAVRRQFGSQDGGLETQVNISFIWMTFFQYFFVALGRMGMENISLFPELLDFEALPFASV